MWIRNLGLKILSGTLLGALALTSVGIAQIPPDVMACAQNRYRDQCLYFARFPGTKQYERPDIASRVVANDDGSGRPVQVDWLRAKDAPYGWLPLSTVGSSSKRVQVRWVQVDKLVRPNEFRRVVGCWPIASLNYELGDSVFRAKFTKAGEVRILDKGEHSHVTFVPNLVLIRTSDGLFVFGFDPKTRKVKFWGGNDAGSNSGGSTPIRFFLSEQLGDCDGELKLD